MWFSWCLFSSPPNFVWNLIVISASLNYLWWAGSSPCFTWSPYPSSAVNFNKPTIAIWFFYVYSFNILKLSQTCLVQNSYYIGNILPISQLCWWFSVSKTNITHPLYHLHVSSKNSDITSFRGQTSLPYSIKLLTQTSLSYYMKMFRC